MYIHNVRLGFATNSSSSHSILLNPTAERFKNGDKDSYGWENFMLRTKKDKSKYLAAQFFSNLQQELSVEYSLMITESLLGAKLINENTYVDHQSLITLPRRYTNPKEIDLDFAKEFFHYVLSNKDIGIAGGNDNDDDPYSYGGVVDPVCSQLPKDDFRGSVVCRKDGDYWILFNRKTGAKIRFSFINQNPYAYTTAPELVDIKITDYCGFSCSFCYMSSTIRGQHSNVVPDILRELSEKKVFEVAFGGGETTQHPCFAALIKEAKQNYIVPNFTSFTTNWTHDPEISHTVIECCGGFALSVNSYRELPKIAEIAMWKKAVDFTGEVSIQCILGVCPDYFIVSVMQEMNKVGLRKLTLLGYKSFGRGASLPENQVQANNMEFLLQKARELYISVGMDTQGVKTYKHELKKLGIHRLLMTEHEGVFSCYINAVDMFVAPDSYHDGAKYPFDLDWHSEKHLKHVLANAFPFVESVN